MVTWHGPFLSYPKSSGTTLGSVCSRKIGHREQPKLWLLWNPFAECPWSVGTFFPWLSCSAALGTASTHCTEWQLIPGFEITFRFFFFFVDFMQCLRLWILTLMLVDTASPLFWHWCAMIIGWMSEFSSCRYTWSYTSDIKLSFWYMISQRDKIFK